MSDEQKELEQVLGTESDLAKEAPASESEVENDETSGGSSQESEVESAPAEEVETETGTPEAAPAETETGEVDETAPVPPKETEVIDNTPISETDIFGNSFSIPTDTGARQTQLPAGVFSEDQIKRMEEDGTLSPEQANLERWKRNTFLATVQAARDEVNFKITEKAKADIWGLTASTFKGIDNPESQIYKTADQIYKKYPMLQQFPMGQFFSGLFADWMINRKNDLARARSIGRKQAIEQRRIVGKQFVDSKPSPGKPNKPAVKLTEEQKTAAKRFGMSHEEYVKFQNPNIHELRTKPGANGVRPGAVKK